jgi:ADP-ribose pyrophosphatase YjhB (NUDIX family)
MKTNKKKIRPLAICVFRNRGLILVAEGYDKSKKEHYYRPLGGVIEFGESSEETVQREIMEEIGAEIYGLKYLGTLENIFEFNGKPGHEIVSVYDGSFKKTEFYKQPEILDKESKRKKVRAIWKRLDEFRSREAILYPSGLLELLSKHR